MRKNMPFGKMDHQTEPSSKADMPQPMGNGSGPMQSAQDPSVSNHLYFYTPVTSDTVLRLNQQIMSLTLELQCQALRLNHTPAGIFLHISSGGGFIMDGLNALDTIANNPIPVTTIVEGFCASAATFLSVVGKRRLMKRNSYMLIHQLSTVAWGTMQQVEDDMENNRNLMKKIKEIYKTYSKVPMKEIDEILKHDLYWDAEKCKELGLIDEII